MRNVSHSVLYSDLERLMSLYDDDTSVRNLRGCWVCCIYMMDFSFCAAEDVLDFFRDSFIKWTDANAVLHELRHKKIISDGVMTEIKRNSDSKQQNEILHRWLTKSCDKEALKEVCDMMIAVDGNRRMNTLGGQMKSKIEVSILFSVCVCVCVLVCYNYK